MAALLGRLEGVEVHPYRRGSRAQAFWTLLRHIHAARPDLVVMEGTGLPGGAALLASALLWGTPYVVSSGDAVGPWVGQRHAALGPLFSLYERLLCRASAGFIGWTPYLAGRALTFGAPRAMTAPGWSPRTLSPGERLEARRALRAELDIPADALVVGLAGSLGWNRRRRSCYGLELARALNRVKRDDVHVLVVGDGEGRARLEQEVHPSRRARLHLPGRVPYEDVPRWLCALDLASLPQTLDGVGLFRFTTKLAEYQAACLPVLTGRLPAAYDLRGAWVRLPGNAPWDERYLSALAATLDGMTGERLTGLRSGAEAARAHAFDREDQVDAVTAFVGELLEDLAAPR